MSRSEAAARRARWRARLHAWWEGIDPPPAGPEAPPRRLEAPAALAPAAGSGAAVRAWPPQRIAAAQRIWGRDFVTPGRAAFTVELAKPFGAGPRTSLCDLQAGLGGGTRAIAKTFGVWVTGLEPDPDLAEAAHRRSCDLAVERKAPIRAYDPERLALPPESFDCLFAREGFCQVADKKRLLEGLAAGLRDRGQLIFTDLVLANGAGARGAVEPWAAAEPRRPHPWPLQRLLDGLADQRFDIRIRQDITRIYRGLIGVGFESLMDEIQGGALDRPKLAPVLAEAERWVRRSGALDRGGLRCYRIHAHKRAG